MNIYLKTELEKVTQEQKRLLIKAHNSSLTETVLANDHNPVLKEDFEKYNALLRMREILDKHFLNIKSRNEYLELSKIAGLKLLDDYTYRVMVCSQVLYDREISLINRRINELKKNNNALTNNLEYQSLLKMQEILKNGFDTMDYQYDYLKLRVNTNFPKINNDEYLMLMNQKLANEEKNPRVKKEESLVVVPTPKESLSIYTPKKEETKTNISFKPDNETKKIENEEEKTTAAPQNKMSFENGEKIRVVKKRKGAINWISKNKKQILIALAITALIAAIVAICFQVLPAINAAANAAEISKIGTSMVNNSLAWHSADTATQTILHANNITLAESLKNIAGIQSVYNNATGVWTIGGAELSNFAASAAVNAEATISGATSTIHNLLGITGIGTLGAIGALITKNKSDEYQKYHDQIKQMGVMNEEEQKNLILSIHNSPTLNYNEKTRLIKKATKIQEKIQKYDTKMGR